MTKIYIIEKYYFPSGTDQGYWDTWDFFHSNKSLTELITDFNRLKEEIPGAKFRLITKEGVLIA